MDLQTIIAAIEGGHFPLTWPGQWIHGQWQGGRKGGSGSGGVKSSLNPNNGQKLMDVAPDKESVTHAVDASYQARSSLAETPLSQRLEVLRRVRQSFTDFQEPLQRTLRVEAGHAHWEARDDFAAAVQYLDWIVEHGTEISEQLLAPLRIGNPHGEVRLLPLGVAVAYLPFSAPLTNFVLYLSAAMLAGCPLLISASVHATLSGVLYAAILRELDLPPSWINFVYGNFNSFKQLVVDKRVAAVLYTGSREHCDQIRVESRSIVGRQSILQSGGKNAVIVDASADLTHAVKCVTYGALKSAGQRCTSTSRVFVHKDRSSEFREQMVAAFQQIKIGRTDVDYASHQDEPFMGPLYSAKAVEKYLRYQTMANRESERTLIWGKQIDVEGKGHFVVPSLHYVSQFDNQSAYQGNVLFSPDVAIYDFASLDTAIEQINTTDAAFAVSFIGDSGLIDARRYLFLAPNLLVNQPTVETGVSLPLAGRLHSGHHRFHGPAIALYLCYPQVLDRGVGFMQG